MLLEGLDDPVSHSCLWTSKRVLGRLNRRGVGDREFGHGLYLGRALDKFAMAHSRFEQEVSLLFKPCLSNFDTLYGNRTHATSLDPWIGCILPLN